MHEQFTLAIDLAIGLADGTAGAAREGGNQMGDVRWTTARGPLMVPHRIDRRAWRLFDAAIETLVHRPRLGRAHADEAAWLLRRWRRTGHWRHVIRLMPARRPVQQVQRQRRRAA